MVSPMGLTYVVTGAGRGVGRAIAERLAGRGHVIAVDRDGVALRWTADRPTVDGLAGDATDEQILTAAVERASEVGRSPAGSTTRPCSATPQCTTRQIGELLELITANIALAVAGSATAIRRFCPTAPKARS